MAETAATHSEVTARRSALGGLSLIAADWLPGSDAAAGGPASPGSAAAGPGAAQAPPQPQPQLPPVPPEFAAGFASFAVEKLGAQAALLAPLRGDFSFGDAAALGVLLDLASLQLLLARRCGDAWTAYAAAVMQSAGCPPPAVEQYVAALKVRVFLSLTPPLAAPAARVSLLLCHTPGMAGQRK